VRFQGSEQDLLSAMSPCVQYPNISVVFARTNFSSSADPHDAATLVSVKGGGTYWSHNHLDLGSFSYESRAVRWAFDLGLEKCVCHATLRHTPMSKFVLLKQLYFRFASPFFVLFYSHFLVVRGDHKNGKAARVPFLVCCWIIKGQQHSLKSFFFFFNTIAMTTPPPCATATPLVALTTRRTTASRRWGTTR
jgi:hypothetical protein